MEVSEKTAWSVTLMIQRSVGMTPEDEEREAVSELVRKLEGEGWSVSVESVEPTEELWAEEDPAPREGSTSVRCRRCSARPGESCSRRSGDGRVKVPTHRERKKDAAASGSSDECPHDFQRDRDRP